MTAFNEQHIQSLSVQRRSLQRDLIEVESALEELGTSDEVYKIVGTLMIRSDSSALVAELEEKRSLLKQRIHTLEEQESRLQRSSARDD